MQRIPPPAATVFDPVTSSLQWQERIKREGPKGSTPVPPSETVADLFGTKKYEKPPRSSRSFLLTGRTTSRSSTRSDAYHTGHTGNPHSISDFSLH